MRQLELRHKLFMLPKRNYMSHIKNSAGSGCRCSARTFAENGRRKNINHLFIFTDQYPNVAHGVVGDLAFIFLTC